MHSASVLTQSMRTGPLSVRGQPNFKLMSPEKQRQQEMDYSKAADSVRRARGPRPADTASAKRHSSDGHPARSSFAPPSDSVPRSRARVSRTGRRSADRQRSDNTDSASQRESSTRERDAGDSVLRLPESLLEDVFLLCAPDLDSHADNTALALALEQAPALGQYMQRQRGIHKWWQQFNSVLKKLQGDFEQSSNSWTDFKLHFWNEGIEILSDDELLSRQSEAQGCEPSPGASGRDSRAYNRIMKGEGISVSDDGTQNPWAEHSSNSAQAEVLPTYDEAVQDEEAPLKPVQDQPKQPKPRQPRQPAQQQLEVLLQQVGQLEQAQKESSGTLQRIVLENKALEQKLAREQKAQNHFLSAMSPGSLSAKNTNMSLAEYDITDLKRSASEGDLFMVKAILRKQPDLSTRRSLAEAACCAARYGHVSIIKALHSNFDANLRQSDSTGFTPMGVAAYYGHSDAIKALASLGVLVSSVGVERNWITPLDPDGKIIRETPLQLAEKRKHAQTVTVIRELLSSEHIESVTRIQRMFRWHRARQYRVAQLSFGASRLSSAVSSQPEPTGVSQLDRSVQWIQNVCGVYMGEEFNATQNEEHEHSSTFAQQDHATVDDFQSDTPGDRVVLDSRAVTWSHGPQLTDSALVPGLGSRRLGQTSDQFIDRKALDAASTSASQRQVNSSAARVSGIKERMREAGSVIGSVSESNHLGMESAQLREIRQQDARLKRAEIDCKRLLELIFKRYQPAMLDSIEPLLDKYHGREDDLLNKIIVKYEPRFKQFKAKEMPLDDNQLWVVIQAQRDRMRSNRIKKRAADKFAEAKLPAGILERQDKQKDKQQRDLMRRAASAQKMEETQRKNCKPRRAPKPPNWEDTPVPLGPCAQKHVVAHAVPVALQLSSNCTFVILAKTKAKVQEFRASVTGSTEPDVLAGQLDDALARKQIFKEVNRRPWGNQVDEHARWLPRPTYRELKKAFKLHDQSTIDDVLAKILLHGDVQSLTTAETRNGGPAPQVQGQHEDIATKTTNAEKCRAAYIRKVQQQQARHVEIMEMRANRLTKQESAAREALSKAQAARVSVPRTSAKPSASGSGHLDSQMAHANHVLCMLQAPHIQEHLLELQRRKTDNPVLSREELENPELQLKPADVDALFALFASGGGHIAISEFL